MPRVTQKIVYFNPCLVETDFVKPKNILTFEPAVQILHCDLDRLAEQKCYVFDISQNLKPEYFQRIFTLMFGNILEQELKYFKQPVYQVTVKIISGSRSRIRFLDMLVINSLNSLK